MTNRAGTLVIIADYGLANRKRAQMGEVLRLEDPVTLDQWRQYKADMLRLPSTEVVWENIRVADHKISELLRDT
jgi:hypothetical protein